MVHIETPISANTDNTKKKKKRKNKCNTNLDTINMSKPKVIRLEENDDEPTRDKVRKSGKNSSCYQAAQIRQKQKCSIVSKFWHIPRNLIKPAFI